MPFVPRLAAFVLAGGLALSVAAPAAASPETLKRSVGNLLMFPFDVATAPIVAGTTVYRNLNDIDDSTAVRVFYPIPGYVWTTAVQIGAGVLRGVTGALELVPGLILLPFETDLGPLFDPSIDNEALVNLETPVIDIKFGVDYTTSPF